MKLRHLLLLLSVSLLAACGKKETVGAYDCTADFQRFIQEEKNEKGEPWIHIKTAADLPTDLKWEHGEEQQEYGSDAAQKGGTFHYFITDYPRTVRHVGPDANGSERRYMLDFFYLPLLKRNLNTLEPIPACAKEWARGADGRTFYFRIDPDAKFSDGEAVRVDNVLFNLYFMISPHLKDPWYPAEYKKKIGSVTKYDDFTLSVTMNQAKPDSIYHAGDMLTPYPIGFFKEFGPDYVERYNWRFVPTTGAYELREGGLKKGQSMTLHRIKDWWAKDKRFYRQLFNPDRIVLDVVRDPNKAIELFKSGELDCYPLNLPERWHKDIADTFPAVANGHLHKSTFYNQAPRPTYGFYLNTSRPPLDNRDIREGLHYATNWDLVIKQIFYGDSERLNSGQDGYDTFTNPAVIARPFDVAKAAECFAKAGFTERGPDGVLKNAKGQRLSFTITNTYKILEAALVVIKEEAKKAGVEFNLETPEATAAWKKYNERKHDIAFTAFNISVEMYPRFWETYHSSNAYDKDGKPKPDTNNFTMTNDKELDAMIDKYDYSSDKAEMLALAHQMQQYVHDSAVFIPGFKNPWYRTGHWRWMHFPENFNAKHTRDHEESWVFWINDAERDETLEAAKTGKTWPKVVKNYEQFRSK